MSPERLERFSAGERFAVDPDAIERELSSLWRAAGAASEGKSPVTRACLWNVVLHRELRAKQEGHGQGDAMGQLIRELPQYLAARALVLSTLPAGEGAELESWISANCIVAGGGGKLVCSEELAIQSRGEGERHLPALVRALLVPAVPTAVVFGGVPAASEPLAQHLLEAAERIITQVDVSLSPAPLRRLLDLAPRPRLGVMDLGWLECAPLRALLASLFDPPTTAEDAAALERIRVTAPAGRRWSGRLLLAFIARALGGEMPRRIGEGAWRFSRAGGRSLEALLLEGAPGRLPSVELSGPRGQYAVLTDTGPMARVEGPAFQARKPLGLLAPAGLLARGLGTRGDDQSFADALALGALL